MRATSRVAALNPRYPRPSCPASRMQIDTISKDRSSEDERREAAALQEGATRGALPPGQRQQTQRYEVVKISVIEIGRWPGPTRGQQPGRLINGTVSGNSMRQLNVQTARPLTTPAEAAVIVPSQWIMFALLRLVRWVKRHPDSHQQHRGTTLCKPC